MSFLQKRILNSVDENVGLIFWFSPHLLSDKTKYFYEFDYILSGQVRNYLEKFQGDYLQQVTFFFESFGKNIGLVFLNFSTPQAQSVKIKELLKFAEGKKILSFFDNMERSEIQKIKDSLLPLMKNNELVFID